MPLFIFSIFHTQLSAFWLLTHFTDFLNQLFMRIYSTGVLPEYLTRITLKMQTDTHVFHKTLIVKIALREFSNMTAWPRDSGENPALSLKCLS